MYEYLKELNEAQRAAVENYEGASLVIAGAGSGKTRVLTYRIAHLLANKVPPHKILALTFTNKAASEMKERIGALVGPALARGLWMGTFHSVFARMLRAEAKTLGYSSNFSIYDTIDSKNLIRKIVKEKNLDDKLYKPNDVLGRISSAKNNLITAAAYSANNQIIQQDQKMRRGHLAELYRSYAARCKKSDAMDFDDLLLNTNLLFRDHTEILEKYQDYYDYILVDEYQDTNFSQYVIIKKLSAKKKNICVVGDDAQSIYSFRGAKIENILNFKNDYPGYQLYKLEQNYRSTQTIVNAANSLIKKNENQIPKKVYSKNQTGSKIKVVDTETDRDEAYFIAQSIQDAKINNNWDFKDFSILYRTNAQSRSFEEALRKYNIPYKVYGSISFYQRKEIKDLLAYFRLAINPIDEEALTRVINYPARGIGQTSLQRMIGYAQSKGTNLWQVITNISKEKAGLNSGAVKRVNEFKALIESFSEIIKERNAYEAAHQIAKESGILKELFNPGNFEDQSKYENVEELLNGIQDFVDHYEGEGTPLLAEFMENVALLTNMDNEKSEDIDKVTLMTVHSAKGLEFKQVFLAGLEEELFPSNMSVNTQKELEEERRLFYVAITRAEIQATITYTNQRYKWGVPTSCRPSRFIYEIDESYLEMPEQEQVEFSETPSTKTRTVNQQRFNPRKKKTEKATVPPVNTLNHKKLVKLKDASRKVSDAAQHNITPDDPSEIRTGMLVKHAKFGKGEVKSIEGNPPNIKAKVEFETAGTKQLLLKFAKLEIVKKL